MRRVWALTWGFEGQPDRSTSSILVEYVDRLWCKQSLAVGALVEDRDGLSFFHHHLGSDWAERQIWIVSRTEYGTTAMAAGPFRLDWCLFVRT